MSWDEKDLENIKSVLNLEYGATFRYDYQMSTATNPRIHSALEGLRRNEKDHIQAAISELKKTLPEEDKKGFATTLLHLRMDMAFEREANRIYGQFQREADTPEKVEFYKNLVRSESGHMNVIRDLITRIEKGEFPAIFYCPVCGWELDFGTNPQPGDILKCPKCGRSFKLALQDGDFILESC